MSFLSCSVYKIHIFDEFKNYSYHTKEQIEYGKWKAIKYILHLNTEKLYLVTRYHGVLDVLFVLFKSMAFGWIYVVC